MNNKKRTSIALCQALACFIRSGMPACSLHLNRTSSIQPRNRRDIVINSSLFISKGSWPSANVTHRQTDGQALPNMPPQLLRNLGHKNVLQLICSSVFRKCKTHDLVLQEIQWVAMTQGATYVYCHHIRAWLNICLASFLWDIRKLSSRRRIAENAASNQGLCLLS